MDNLTKEYRRKNMRNIRSKDTMPEKIIMRELQKRGIYFAKNVSSIAGKPDIVFRRKKVAVFIDSDFWHRHPKRFIMPKTNVKYWRNKIKSNQLRDKKVNKYLMKDGWEVMRIWEYDIKRNTNRCVNKIVEEIGGSYGKRRMGSKV
ncbi:MAG: very short patch repair endonuclease [Candidatus Omnitrophica bacterium]|nr:very short patch repair endonuclease [Candidatus Omnitrophota bacterium]MBU4037732.1 very short patch repair endonuclease [Pseudomonadota bacterium]